MLRGFGREKSWVANGSWQHQKHSHRSSPAWSPNRDHGLDSGIAGPLTSWEGKTVGGCLFVCLFGLLTTLLQCVGCVHIMRGHTQVRGADYKTALDNTYRINIHMVKNGKTAVSHSSMPLSLLTSSKTFRKVSLLIA